MGDERQGHILVVDDDRNMQTALQAFLADAGYSVVTAGDGKAGLRRFHEGGVYLVITDFVMSRMNGLDLVRAIKRESPRTPVIMMTTDVSVVEDFVERCGIDCLLAKHVLEAELLGAVRTLLNVPGPGGEK